MCGILTASEERGVEQLLITSLSSEEPQSAQYELYRESECLLDTKNIWNWENKVFE